MEPDSIPPESAAFPDEIRCPICAELNARMSYCRHVRWTFDQGDPIDFAHFSIETSPYVRARGFDAGVIPDAWWKEHEEWVIEQVLTRFDAVDGYVFGHVAELDLLSKDIWLEFHPDPVPPYLTRR